MAEATLKGRGLPRKRAGNKREGKVENLGRVGFKMQFVKELIPNFQLVIGGKLCCKSSSGFARGNVVRAAMH